MVYNATQCRPLTPAAIPPAKLSDLVVDAGSAVGAAVSRGAQIDAALDACRLAQAHPAWCWAATAAMLIDAFARAGGVAWATPSEPTKQADVLGPLAALDRAPPGFFAALGVPFLDDLPLAVARVYLEHVTFAGIPPALLAGVLGLHGHHAEFVKGEPAAAARFRRDLADCADSIGTNRERRLVVAFSRKVFGLLGDGHFAPVAGVSADHGWVLLLESNSWRYPPRQWVAVDRLWAACCTATGYGFLRGYFVVHARA